LFFVWRVIAYREFAASLCISRHLSRRPSLYSKKILKHIGLWDVIRKPPPKALVAHPPLEDLTH